MQTMNGSTLGNSSMWCERPRDRCASQREMQTGGRGEQGVKEMLSCRSVTYNTAVCADCCACCRTFICRPKVTICARTFVHHSCIALPAFAVTPQHDAVRIASDLPHWSVPPYTTGLGTASKLNSRAPALLHLLPSLSPAASHLCDELLRTPHSVVISWELLKLTTKETKEEERKKRNKKHAA
jgi:hypothetical protein